MVLDHGDEYYSLYAHNARTFVRESEFVEEGQLIAKVGQSPYFGPGLYFELRHYSDPIDPILWIKDSGAATLSSQDL